VILVLRVVLHVADLLGVVVLRQTLLKQIQIHLVDQVRLAQQALAEVAVAEAPRESLVVGHAHDALHRVNTDCTYLYLLKLITTFAHVVVHVERVVDMDLRLWEERKRVINFGHLVQIHDLATVFAWQRARDRVVR
jgi:hypothetical protein